MQVSVSSITTSPPRVPAKICTKNFPPPWGFCIQAFARGTRICCAAPEWRAFVYKRCLPFLKFASQWQELETPNTLGFICCSEILYVFKENYSILTESAKQFVRHLILGVLWKSVCINNHIEEFFTVLLTTDLRLSSI